MGKMKWLGAVILTLALLAVMPLAVLAATGISDQGGTVGETEDSLYAILQDGNDYSLYSMPAAGGSMTKLDTAQTMDNLVVGTDGTAYYLAGDGTAFYIKHVAADKTITTLVPFNAGITVKRLSWYDGMLYCLVDNKLTIVDPAAGDQDEVCPLSVSEYVIIDDVIFYVSGDDIATYTHEMTDGNMLVTSGGKLYSMTSTGTNSELLLDKGVTDLKAAGDYLYFHDMEDNYAMGSSDDMWLEGKLYRYNIQTGQLTSMNLDYDWDFFPTSRGVVIYTSQDVSLYPLTGGDGKVLMAPELYTTLTVFGDAAYVYEHSSGVLTEVPLDGSAAIKLSAGTVTDLTAEGTETPDETTTDDTTTDDTTLTDDTTDTTTTDGATDDTEVSDDSDSSGSHSSSSATSSGYIFPNSASKKLTRSQILKVSKSKWGYARNEIYARHGYKFKSSKYKKYFANKTWYKPGSFSTGELNSIEWYNMELIKSMEVEYGLLNGSSSSSGSNSGATSNSYIFPNSSKKKLTDSQLKKMTKKRLGIARNEILARHGYVFKSSYYKKYFKNQKWYKAGGYSSGKLNDIEWYNIKLIKKWEAKK